MYRYIFDNHELRVEPSSISQDFNLYIYHLICWKKGSSARAQKLDVYNNFRNEYRFCPYCGQNISQGINFFLSNMDSEKIKNGVLEKKN